MNTPPIRAPKEGRPVITMTSLGVNGRFANQLFQYAFLKTYALRHDLRVETPPWIGNVLFGASDPLPSRPLQLVKQEGHDPDTDPVAAAAAPLRDVDLWGYFQYHTKYYAPFRDYIRRLFTPVPEISAALSPALERLRARTETGGCGV